MAQRLDLEELEPRLHAAGIKSTQLTVTAGVESITITGYGDTIVVDQNGDVTGTDIPETLTTAIEDFRNGNVAGA